MMLFSKSDIDVAIKSFCNQRKLQCQRRTFEFEKKFCKNMLALNMR